MRGSGLLCFSRELAPRTRISTKHFPLSTSLLCHDFSVGSVSGGIGRVGISFRDHFIRMGGTIGFTLLCGYRIDILG